MVRAYDRSSVELHVRCLLAWLSSGLEYSDEVAVVSMIEDCQEWLSHAHAEAHGRE